MRKMRSLAMLVALVVGSAGNGQAEQCTTTHELVGFTSATLNGGQGVFAYTQTCQAQFGAQARMCDSLEALRTTNLPAGLVGSAWVRPFFAPTSIGAVDASGASANGAELSCQGWTRSDASGLTVTAAGGFPLGSCNQARPVACCVPTSTTVASVVPALRPAANGLLAAMLLSVGVGTLLFRKQRYPVLSGGERRVKRRS
jgi:hypothetical protein